MQKTQMRKRVKKLAQQIHYKETKKYHKPIYNKIT